MNFYNTVPDEQETIISIDYAKSAKQNLANDNIVMNVITKDNYERN